MAVSLTDGDAVLVQGSPTADKSDESDQRSYGERWMEQQLGRTPKQQSYTKQFRSHNLSHASSGDGNISPVLSHIEAAYKPQIDLYAEPCQTEIDSCIPQVKQKLQEACNSAPYHEGLVIIFACAMGCEGVTKSIPSIDNSRILICKAYEHQKHTTCTFINPSKAEMIAVYQQIAKDNHMSAFKFFLSHYIGHGLNNYICLKDGFLSVVYLKNILSRSNAPELRDKVRGLVFDCCRVETIVKHVTNPEEEENLFVYFAVPYGYQAYVYNNGGASISTIEFVKLMKGRRTYKIRELFVKHHDAVQKAVARIDDHVDCGNGFTAELTSDVVIVRGTPKKVVRRRICSAVTAVAMATSVLLCSLIYFLCFYYPHLISLLLKAGDAIDCGSFIHPLWRYSAVEYQKKCKGKNDCKSDFTVTVTSIDKSETKKYSQAYSGLIDEHIAAHENTSITEDLYETYPVYIWGAVINLTVQTSEYTEPPRLFQMYIMCDQHNFQNFQDGNKPFQYIYMHNLDKDRTEIPNITVHRNCYVYVGIRIYAKSAIHVSATFNIEYFYLNISNPKFDPGYPLNEDKVRYLLDRSGDKVIVCKSEEIDNPLSTHIDLTFDELHRVILPPIFVLLFILFFIFVVAIAVLIYSFSQCKRSSKGYQELQQQT